MAKHKVSELTGALLDAAVAEAQGMDWEINDSLGGRCVVVSGDVVASPVSLGIKVRHKQTYQPSSFWQEGGPIIERERIELRFLCANESHHESWVAFVAPVPEESASDYSRGCSPLIAAMRAFVSSKFGEEIDL